MFDLTMGISLFNATREKSYDMWIQGSGVGCQWEVFIQVKVVGFQTIGRPAVLPYDRWAQVKERMSQMMSSNLSYSSCCNL
jgi:hypothetical protein